jgi:DNA primase
MILEQGMNVKIVLFPDGEDPDSYARKHRSADVEAFIATEASDFIAFKTRLLLDETNNDPIKKAGLIHEIIGTISIIPDPIIRPLYVRECSEIMGIAEQTLMNELNRLLRKKATKGFAVDKEAEDFINQPVFVPPQEPSSDDNDCTYQEYDVIRVLLTYGDLNVNIPVQNQSLDEESFLVLKVAKFICNDLRFNQIEFDNSTYSNIFKEYSDFVDTEMIPDDSYFLQHQDFKIMEVTIGIISHKYELSPGWGYMKISVPLERDKIFSLVNQTVLSLLERKVTIKIDEVLKLIKNTSIEDQESIQDYMSKFKHLNTVFIEINKRLGREKHRTRNR